MSFDLLPTDYQVKVRSSGYLESVSNISVNNSRSSSHTFYLNHSLASSKGKITLNVKDVLGRKYLNGMAIIELGNDREIQKEESKGQIIFHSLKAGEYKVRVSAYGHQPQTKTITIGTNEDHRTNIFLEPIFEVADLVVTIRHNDEENDSIQGRITIGDRTETVTINDNWSYKF